MLPEVVVSCAGVGVLLLAALVLIVKLILGLIVVIRARRQDLPKIVRGIAGWFYRPRR